MADPRHISEKDFTKQVIDLAHVYHWRVAHFRAAMTKHGWRTAVQADGKGFPDLVMVRPRRVIFAELKTDKGKATPEQTDWYYALKLAGVEVYVWRPKNFDSLQKILQ